MGDFKCSFNIIMKIQVLLWNVWNLPSCLTDGQAAERARKISPLLQPYDIVILNEAFCNKKHLLSEADFPFREKLGRQWYTIFDSGLMILSKFPIIKTAFMHYKKRARVDFFAAKGILMCKIELEHGRILDVYATHMQAGNSRAEQKARDAQSLEVAEFVYEHSVDAQAVLFAGDLNMGPTQDATYTKHSVHYANSQDAKLRTDAYVRMRNGAGLKEISDNEDICRFLYRDSASLKLFDAAIHYPRVPRGLSDTSPLMCTFDI